MDINIYALTFGHDALEFHVMTAHSLTQTRAFPVPIGQKFVYAAAQIWLNRPSGRQLVSSEFHTGNLVELLKAMSLAFLNPPPFADTCGAITRGGVGTWMHAYWDRIQSESSSLSDERLYEQLFPLCVLAEDRGCVAVYTYEGLPTIEITSQEKFGSEEPPTVCHTFDPRQRYEEIQDLKQRIMAEIGARLTIQ